jgi:hypothetical protein
MKGEKETREKMLEPEEGIEGDQLEDWVKGGKRENATASTFDTDYYLSLPFSQDYGDGPK